MLAAAQRKLALANARAFCHFASPNLEVSKKRVTDTVSGRDGVVMRIFHDTGWS